MHKTTLYLGEDLHVRLMRVAQERGVTQALVLREALVEYIASPARKPRSIGMGRSGRKLKGRLSERAEELLHGMGEQ